MNKLNRVTSIAVGAIFGLILFVAPPSLAMANASGTAAAAHSGNFDPDWYCAYDCRECDAPPGSSDSYHRIDFNGNPLGWESAHDEACNEGTCSAHRSCHWAFATIDDVWNAAQTANGSQLRKMIAAHKTEIRFNAERASLQLYCDAGILIGNLPLTKPQLVALQTLAHMSE